MPVDPQTEPKDPLPGPGFSPSPARRLTRSTSDKHVAGVAGGLGQYFGIDPIIFRIAFAAAALVSGVGIVAYIALTAFLPSDRGETAWIEGRSRVTSVLLIGALCIAGLTMLAPPAFFFGPGLLGVAAVTALALLLFRAFGGNVREDPARAIARATLALVALAASLGAATGVGLLAALGGGPAMAAIAIFAGLMLITAGFLGGPRWLILPVTVLVLPLAVVSAADIDLTGGAGESLHRPAAVTDLKPEYRLGVGHMELDLSRLELPPGRTEVKLSLGMGEAQVRVPDGVCVSTRGSLGAGEAELPSGREQGTNLGLDHTADPASGARELVVDADIGVGHLEIDRPLGGPCA
jgi:phage shock protein PspC (stress-responsive transcriptional regulator)